MKKLVFGWLLVAFSFSLFGQTELLLQPGNVGLFGASGTSILGGNAATGAARWLTQSEAQAGLNYWMLNGGSLSSASRIAVGTNYTEGYWAAGVGYGSSEMIISYADAATDPAYSKTGLTIFNESQTQGNLSIIRFGTTQSDPNRVATSAIYGIHTPNSPRSTGWNAGAIGFMTVNSSGVSAERMRLTSEGLLGIGIAAAESVHAVGNIRAFGTFISDALVGTGNRLSWVTPSGAIGFADASSTSNSTQVAISAQGTRNLRLGAGGSTVTLATGTDKNFTVRDDGSTSWNTGLTADPTSPFSGSMWYRGDLGRFMMRNGTTNTTISQVETDFIGDDPVSKTANFDVGGASGAEFATVCNANGGAFTATLKSTMLEGRTYYLVMEQNATNAISIAVEAGGCLKWPGATQSCDATQACGGGGTGANAANKNYQITRFDTIYIVTE